MHAAPSQEGRSITRLIAPRLPSPRRSGRELLSVARGGLHDLGARLTAEGVVDRVSVAGLVPAHTRIVRLLLPIGARRIALDLPFAMPHGPHRRLVECRPIVGPIDHSLAGFTG